MTDRRSDRRSATWLAVAAALLGILSWEPGALAKSSSGPADKDRSAKVVACDYRLQPTITMVKPDRAKPGQKITISGKNFGSKECFHTVSFGAKNAKEFAYLSPTTLQVTVPNLQPGSVPVRIYTEAGTSQMEVEIQPK